MNIMEGGGGGHFCRHENANIFNGIYIFWNIMRMFHKRLSSQETRAN